MLLLLWPYCISNLMSCIFFTAGLMKFDKITVIVLVFSHSHLCHKPSDSNGIILYVNTLLSSLYCFLASFFFNFQLYVLGWHWLIKGNTDINFPCHYASYTYVYVCVWHIFLIWRFWNLNITTIWCCFRLEMHYVHCLSQDWLIMKTGLNYCGSSCEGLS